MPFLCHYLDEIEQDSWIHFLKTVRYKNAHFVLGVRCLKFGEIDTWFPKLYEEKKQWKIVSKKGNCNK